MVGGSMKVLIAGDIVGSQGRTVFAQVATRMRAAGEADLVIANAENAAGGKGLTSKVADELLSAGADVLTLGDHAWDQKELVTAIECNERILRPLNLPPGCPGNGAAVITVDGVRITVISLIGRVFMPAKYDCPFRAVDAYLKHLPKDTIAIVDMHAEATSEKIVMGRYLDGRAAAVVGTHTHVQTSDEVVLPGGTAYITDLGMTGVKDSAIGRDLESVTAMFLTGMPGKFQLAKGAAVLEGVAIDLDCSSGRARSISRLRATMQGAAKTSLG